MAWTRQYHTASTHCAVCSMVSGPQCRFVFVLFTCFPFVEVLIILRSLRKDVIADAIRHGVVEYWQFRCSTSKMWALKNDLKGTWWKGIWLLIDSLDWSDLALVILPPIVRELLSKLLMFLSVNDRTYSWRARRNRSNQMIDKQCHDCSYMYSRDEMWKLNECKYGSKRKLIVLSRRFCNLTQKPKMILVPTPCRFLISTVLSVKKTIRRRIIAIIDR